MSLASPKVTVHIPRRENVIWRKTDKGYSYVNKYTLVFLDLEALSIL